MEVLYILVIGIASTEQEVKDLWHITDISDLLKPENLNLSQEQANEQAESRSWTCSSCLSLAERSGPVVWHAPAPGLSPTERPNSITFDSNRTSEFHRKNSGLVKIMKLNENCITKRLNISRQMISRSHDLHVKVNQCATDI